jgi:hypothetical protein
MTHVVSVSPATPHAGARLTAVAVASQLDAQHKLSAAGVTIAVHPHGGVPNRWEITLDAPTTERAALALASVVAAEPIVLDAEHRALLREMQRNACSEAAIPNHPFFMESIHAQTHR